MAAVLRSMRCGSGVLSGLRENVRRRHGGRPATNELQRVVQLLRHPPSCAAIVRPPAAGPARLAKAPKTFLVV
uniref:Uncharacterized protein n=1 Tax=Arundo donax TaxID=35708 RepID=A0A0A8XNS8_ARUDO